MYEFTKLIFTDLRVKNIRNDKRRKEVPPASLQPHAACCVCFSDTFAAWPAGRCSDVVDPTARRLCIHIKTSPGNQNSDAGGYTRTAERQVSDSPFLGWLSFTGWRRSGGSDWLPVTSHWWRCNDRNQITGPSTSFFYPPEAEFKKINDFFYAEKSVIGLPPPPLFI